MGVDTDRLVHKGEVCLLCRRPAALVSCPVDKQRGGGGGGGALNDGNDPVAVMIQGGKEKELGWQSQTLSLLTTTIFQGRKEE